MRIALVHDYFREYGGAERVVETLHEMFPKAPVFTAFIDNKALGIHAKRFQGWDIRESWGARIPAITSLYSPLRILSDKFFSSFDLSEFDLVISSTNMYMAKAVRVKPGARHFCYCHTPPRSLYGYTTMTNWKKNPIVRVGGELINHYMRLVDFRTAQNPTTFIANSKEVQKRIQKFYRRDSVVIYPPIEVPSTLPRLKKEDFFLSVGRLGASKHTDLVIRTCSAHNIPLRVVGSGKNLDALQQIAGKSVQFLGGISDDELHNLYAKAQAVIYPAEDEDFGMIPVEAMAYGTPAIVHKSGGSLETVIDGKTGLFLNDFADDTLVDAIGRAKHTHWDAQALHHHAKKFSKERFIKEMRSLIREVQ